MWLDPRSAEGMLGEEELKTVQLRGESRSRAAASTAATITTAAGELLTVSEFISRMGTLPSSLHVFTFPASHD